MRGRKPKPTALKIAQGNPGKRAINGAEPKPPTSLPDCPPHLSPEAQAEWHRIAESLNKIGLLTQIDRTTMAAYCQGEHCGPWQGRGAADCLRFTPGRSGSHLHAVRRAARNCWEES